MLSRNVVTTLVRALLIRTVPQKIWTASQFKENQKLPRADWQEVKLDIMRRTDAAKFAQNEDLRQLLLATADAELATAKTADIKANAVNNDMTRSTGTLIEEMQRSSGVPQ